MIKFLKKQNLIAIVFLFISILFISCSKETSSDNFENDYIKETDSQYMYINKFFPSNIVSNDQGFYVSTNAYLYFVDKNSKKSTILCNKPNCLHDTETDTSKKYNCNGFLLGNGSTTTQNLHYYKDELYALTNFNIDDKNAKSSLVKIAKDGSSRETIYKFNEKISKGLLHRGYFYYVVSDYQQNNANSGKFTTADTKLFRLNINKKNPKAEEIFTTGLFQDGITNLLAYGKNLYFSTYGYKDKELKEDGYKLYRYDLEENTTFEILNDSSKGDVGIVGIHKNNLIYSYWYYDDNDERNKEFFISDLNGENSEKFITTNSYGLLDSDDNFVYVDNIVERINDMVDKRIIEFYDINGTVIDTLNLELDEFISKCWTIFPGDRDSIFLIYNDSEYFNIKTIDKKDIGSKNIKINDFFKVSLDNLDNGITY